jgi:hypothetical protein
VLRVAKQKQSPGIASCSVFPECGRKWANLVQFIPSNVHLKWEAFVPGLCFLDSGLQVLMFSTYRKESIAIKSVIQLNTIPISLEKQTVTVINLNG